MAQLGFDATSVEPSQSFSVIPSGTYKVQIVASEMRPTKNGEGQYLWLEMDIIDGEYHGRKLWDRLNLVNANQQAVDIAQRTLSAICHATGKLHVQDSEELHFAPMIATVRVRPAAGQYDASNEIRGYESVSGHGAQGTLSVAKTPAATATANPTAAAKPAATRPWQQHRKPA